MSDETLFIADDQFINRETHVIRQQFRVAFV